MDNIQKFAGKNIRNIRKTDAVRMVLKMFYHQKIIIGICNTNILFYVKKHSLRIDNSRQSRFSSGRAYS